MKNFTVDHLKVLPLLIPGDYIQKETLARLPWGHKVPNRQMIQQ